MSAREGNQNARAVKRAADAGPVSITDRGEPSHVLLSIDEYERLRGGKSLFNAFGVPRLNPWA